MKKTSKTLIFFGNERLATGVSTSAPTLKGLVDAGYHIAAVVSSFTTGTSRSARELEVARLAKAHNIPVLLPEKLSDIKDQLAGYQADAGVLVAYGRIVPVSVIGIFPHGIINIHPSLLPQHRGPTPIESAILHGDKKTGVSLMQLAKEMDAGPVYAQAEVHLAGTEAKQTLADLLLETGQKMLQELLPGILDGDIIAIPQHDASATYDKRISKQDGLIDWGKPAEQLEREVRAYAGWPNSRTSIAGKDVIITKVNTLNLSGRPGKAEIVDKKLVVYCAKDALEIKNLKPAGKREMTGQAFAAGYRLSA